MTYKLLLFIVLSVQCYSALCQFEEDFSDGDLHLNPTWYSDTADFEIRAGVLHLNAKAQTDTSCIFTDSKIGVSGIWELDIEMAFNPSSSNYLDIYLVSDTEDLMDFSEIAGSSMILFTFVDCRFDLFEDFAPTFDALIDIVDGF